MKVIPFFPYADLFKRDEAALSEVMLDVCRRGAYILQKECRDFDANLAKFMGKIVSNNYPVLIIWNLRRNNQWKSYLLS